LCKRCGTLKQPRDSLLAKLKYEHQDYIKINIGLISEGGLFCTVELAEERGVPTGKLAQCHISVRIPKLSGKDSY
jgi:hypothetical protein